MENGEKKVVERRTVKIQASISGVISTGSYQNLRPGFLVEEIIEGHSFTQEQITDIQKKMYQECYNLLKQAEDKAVVERIERERKDFRFLPSPTTGKLLPSVTSIINYDADFFVSAEDLRQYCAQGTVMDAQVKHYVQTGEWKEPKELADIWTELVILKRGNLKLDALCGDFRGFIDKYPIKDLKVAERAFLDDIGTTGEPDLTGIPEFKEAQPIPTVFDLKRTPDKIKNGMQLAVYAKMLGVDQGAIITCNNKTAQKFSKPIVYDKKQLEGYFKMFLKKKEEFHKRYGF